MHPKTEAMHPHPQCRCTMVPRTASWEQLGFPGIPDHRPAIPTGVSLFARLPAGQQREVLGPTRYRLYREGALDLWDLVRPTYNPRWGPGLRPANLSELHGA
jgi:hypothetical protein